MSNTTKIAIFAAIAVGVPVVLVGAAAGAVAALFGLADSTAAQPSQAAMDDIPPRYLTLYQRAAAVCPGLDWTILAAIGKVESDHGRSPLPGVRSGENSAGAGGPLQVLQPTWDAVVARHTIPPGGSTPPSRYDAHDAAHVAAFYLCDSGIRDGDVRRAIFAYNHADWYVEDVLAQAEEYRGVPAPNRPGGGLRLDWPPEQPTMPDPTSNGRITPRTYTLARELQQRGMTGDGMACFGHRPSNPASDHPKGRACDIMFDPHDPKAVVEGWRVANWLIEHQASYGVHYIIWQGKFWSAYDPQWVTYRSDAYGCPDPVNLTGCHMDHVHWSSLAGD